MKLVHTIQELREALAPARARDQSVGFVPTMGALHCGHLSLVERCRAQNDVSVVSIIVNPLQFGPLEDLAAYPRDLQKDADLLRRARADILFAPAVETMFPVDFATYVDVSQLTDGLCGAKRPGHFQGVTTIVARLLGMVRPRRAYFGQKDAQQAVVVRRMVSDLCLDAEIVVRPIVRDGDGPALSSRNADLTPVERRVARALPKSISAARTAFDRGERRVAKRRATVCDVLDAQPHLYVDDVEVVRANDLLPLVTVDATALLAAAVRVGKMRLIDNAILGEAGEGGGPAVTPRRASRAPTRRPRRSHP